MAEDSNYYFSFFNDTTPQEFIDSFSEFSPSSSLPSFAQDAITNFQELVDSGQQSVSTNLEEDGSVNAFGGMAFDFVPADEGTGGLGQISIKFDGESTTLFTLGEDGPISLNSSLFEMNGSFFA